MNIEKFAEEIIEDQNSVEKVERVMHPNQDWLRAKLKDGTEVLLSWIHNHWEWHKEKGDRKITDSVAKSIIDFAKKTKVLTNPLMSEFASVVKK